MYFSFLEILLTHDNQFLLDGEFENIVLKFFSQKIIGKVNYKGKSIQELQIFIVRFHGVVTPKIWYEILFNFQNSWENHALKAGHNDSDTLLKILSTYANLKPWQQKVLYRILWVQTGTYFRMICKRKY